MARRFRGVFVLIALNLMVFLTVWILSLFHGHAPGATNPTMALLCVAADFQEFLSHPWTIITYMVTQYSPLHLLFNMLWLFWFGKMLCEEADNRALLAAYLGGGIAGGAFYLLSCAIWPALTSPGACLCGSSASVLSVMTASALLSPDRRLKFFPVRGVKLKWVVLVCLALTFIGTGGEGNRAGFFAHSGGVVFAVAMEATRRIRHRRGATLRISADTSGGTPAERLDHLLDKIRTSGYASLSSGERRELSEISLELKNPTKP